MPKARLLRIIMLGNFWNTWKIRTPQLCIIALGLLSNNNLVLAAPPEGEQTEILAAKAKEPNVALEEREKALSALKARGGDDAAAALMQLGNQNIYLKEQAVEAIGDLKDVRNLSSKDKLAGYLKSKLKSPDASMIAAASRSLAKVQGEDAVGDLVVVLHQNHRRADGHEIMVQSAVVEALGSLNTPQAVPPLAEELARVDEPGWDLEYGSLVVQSLRMLSGEAAHAAAYNYAAHLAARETKDPLEKEYLRQKIAEARSVHP
jgi:hypothetical protein